MRDIKIQNDWYSTYNTYISFNVNEAFIDLNFEFDRFDCQKERWVKVQILSLSIRDKILNSYSIYVIYIYDFLTLNENFYTFVHSQVQTHGMGFKIDG